jgi:hypothetical protein
MSLSVGPGRHYADAEKAGREIIDIAKTVEPENDREGVAFEYEVRWPKLISIAR